MVQVPHHLFASKSMPDICHYHLCQCHSVLIAILWFYCSLPLWKFKFKSKLNSHLFTLYYVWVSFCYSAHYKCSVVLYCMTKITVFCDWLALLREIVCCEHI